MGDQEKKPKRIPAYDYSAWDKFDVDKACEEVDKEESNKSIKKCEEPKQDEEETDESDEEVLEGKKNLKLIDEAFYEKELVSIENNYEIEIEFFLKLKIVFRGINL